MDAISTAIRNQLHSQAGPLKQAGLAKQALQSAVGGGSGRVVAAAQELAVDEHTWHAAAARDVQEGVLHDVTVRTVFQLSIVIRPVRTFGGWYGREGKGV